MPCSCWNRHVLPVLRSPLISSLTARDLLNGRDKIVSTRQRFRCEGFQRCTVKRSMHFNGHQIISDDMQYPPFASTPRDTSFLTPALTGLITGDCAALQRVVYSKVEDQIDHFRNMNSYFHTCLFGCIRDDHSLLLLQWRYGHVRRRSLTSQELEHVYVCSSVE